jgi:hypothetical protein
VLSGLLQWFGLPEPAQLNPDGTLIAAQFELGVYRNVERWAKDHGVNVELLPER